MTLLRSALEDAELAARRRFYQRNEVINRPDGSFLVLDRETGRVIGSGFSSPERREEPWL